VCWAIKINIAAKFGHRAAAKTKDGLLRRRGNPKVCNMHDAPTERKA